MKTNIGVFVGLVFVSALFAGCNRAANTAIENANIARARSQVANLVNAIKMYQTDYGRLPIRGGAPGDQEFNTVNDDIISLLGGNSIDGLNPRETAYFESRQAEGIDSGKPTNGVYGDGEGLRLVDPWGNPYYIVIDGDDDTMIDGLPGLKSEPLRTTVAAWSEGNPEKVDESNPTSNFIKSWD